MLSVQNISYHVAGRRILDSLNLSLPTGAHAALIGRNGAGKSTLFRIILGELEADNGQVEMPRRSRIVSVTQETPSGAQSLRDYVVHSDAELSDLFKRLETAQDGDEIGEIYEAIEQKDGFLAPSRAAEILSGLGFTEEQQNRSLDSYSGGFRMRVALAAALFQKPDVLLLDEPTNHLDIEAIEWLKSFIKDFPGSVLMISHDRDFLNTCAQMIFHLHLGKANRYNGNFDTFLRTFDENQKAAERFNKKVETKRQHLQRFVDRFMAQPSKSKQAQSKLKALQKLVTVDVLSDDDDVSFTFPDVDHLPSPMIRFDKMDLGYGELKILKRFTGRIDQEDRIALVGANGQGKSTIAKALEGRLEPLSGSISRAQKLRIGYFHQHQLEDLPLDQTSYQMMVDLMPGVIPSKVRAYLGRFSFGQQRADVVIQNLSGGEKVRLVLAKIMLCRPHLLILDEPTNHLDIQAREALMAAINDFEGAVILIAHDRHLIEHTMEQIWIVRDGEVRVLGDGEVY